MSNIYLKSADERTVVKLSNPKLVPQLHQFYFDEGYQVVEYAEFKKIRARIRYRSNHGAPNTACTGLATPSAKLSGLAQNANQ